MKILLTGSEGFIGTHLKERLLSEGHAVIGIDNMSHPCKYRTREFINIDIRNIEEIEEQIKDCDYIVHLGAIINVEESLESPAETLDVNINGTFKLLEIARKYDIPFILAGSIEAYGEKKFERMNEFHPSNPQSPYAASKLGAIGLCKSYFYSYNTRVIIVTNINTFGKYQNDDKWGAVIAKFADRIYKDLPPEIYGDGTQKRDWMGYKDAIDFYMLLINKADKLNLWGEEFIVGMGENISINELADKMIKISGKDLTPVHIKARPGEVKEFLCDNRKALSIGWKPNMDFDTLLKEYMEWKHTHDNN